MPTHGSSFFRRGEVSEVHVCPALWGVLQPAISSVDLKCGAKVIEHRSPEQIDGWNLSLYRLDVKHPTVGGESRPATFKLYRQVPSGFVEVLISVTGVGYNLPAGTYKLVATLPDNSTTIDWVTLGPP